MQVPLYRVDGVILSSKDFGEADRIITMFTREKGKIRSVARGVRRPKNRLVGSSQPFIHADFQLFGSGGLDSISQAQVKHSFINLRSDLERMAMAMTVSELVDETAQEREENEELFTLILATFYWLDGGSLQVANAALDVFMARLISILGYRPGTEVCMACKNELKGDTALSPAAGGVVCSACVREKFPRSARITSGSLRLLKDSFGTDLRSIPSLSGSDEEWKELRSAVSGYVRHIIEKDVSSLRFLENVTTQNRRET